MLFGKKYITTALCLTLMLLLQLSMMGSGARALAGQGAVSYNLTDTLAAEALGTDSLGADRIGVDSLALDSIGADSLAVDSLFVPVEKREGGGLVAVVNYKAQDSLVFSMGNLAWLYGQSQVTYDDITLDAERIKMSLDSSLVHANGVVDSAGILQGKPVFKDSSGEYETRNMSYNFKTAKGYITDVVTQQGDGYVTGGTTKKMANNDIFLENGRYTTCDQTECPHFYINLTKARVRPKKNIVTGPAYLVVADVPLPLAIPFGFFPFTKKYSSGVIFPSYGADQNQGLYLRDGGYYFAINDYVDLALKGEIYTKGSWGISATSRYAWRYKFRGNLAFSYLVTKTGDKGMPDYAEATNMRINWSHSQDSRFNPNMSLSASVNFTTSGYERANTVSYYSPAMTQNTKSSTVNMTYRIPNTTWNISAATSITQRTQDSTIVLQLPDVNLSMGRWYPFKRKHKVGADRWYEKISMTYTGRMTNSITSKQDQLFKKNLLRDWRNGMQHNVPISASFTIARYINISPSITLTDRMYTHRTEQYYDPSLRNADGSYGGVARDTTYGFYNAYNFSTAVSVSTKLYGMYKPLWNSKLVAVRHLFTPSISVNYTPDFSDPMWGSWSTYEVPDATQPTGFRTVKYSYFEGYAFGTTSSGKAGSISLGLNNNIEAKIRSDKDTTGYKKISIIDQLSTSISYNLVADSMRWSSTIPVNATFKWGKNSTMNLSANFDTYMYDENGRHYDKPRWEVGKFPRLMSTGYSWSYSLNNKKLAQLFGFGSKEPEKPKTSLEEDLENGVEEDLDPTSLEAMRQKMEQNDHNTKKQENKNSKYDDDGYLIWKVPWTLNFSYSMRYGYKDFNKATREFNRGITHSASLSGTIQPTAAWNFSWNMSYDFNLTRVTYLNFNCTRDMHCWALTASLNPMGQFASFNVNIAVKSSMLQDLKYEKTSVSRSNKIDWYDD